MKPLFATLAILLCLPVYADDIVPSASPFTGWHWYNEPVTKPAPPVAARSPDAPSPAVPDLSKLSAVEQAKVLRGYTMEALNRAILYPTAENTATYLRWQKFWTDRGSMFSQSFAAAQLRHPELDYNLEYPHYNSMASYVQTRDQQQRQTAIGELAQKYGLFYFYRGADPVDVQMAGVVADFAKLNHLSLIPVSIDGQMAPSVPDTRQDTGQSRAMNVRAYPALYLVSPKTRDYRALAYGFMTQDDLAKRFLDVATGFKPNF
ncbi:type-F conjugative transfer system pilin assembly protein TraF [Scandinavium sp. NPDC088450]|uniref:type-F conjugative transfer system pilin assembly protein TraF n=1 Tax=Scandinavium sp. NPDC088450 TaxID=3364514 RepID=UPI00384F7FD3